MTSQLLADLEWRGLIAQTTDREELTKDLNAKPIKFYIGFDPTAPSLHVGNLVVILVMRRFQLAGHLPNRSCWWGYRVGRGPKWSQ